MDRSYSLCARNAEDIVFAMSFAYRLSHSTMQFQKIANEKNSLLGQPDVLALSALITVFEKATERDWTVWNQNLANARLRRSDEVG